MTTTPLRFLTGLFAVTLATAAFAQPAKEAKGTKDAKPADAAKPPGRTLAAYYDSRAYSGAPPRYVHKNEGDFDAEPSACLSCHKRGTDGAPRTPHPALPECRQCHVRAVVKGEFKPSTFTSVSPPTLRRRALPGAPLVMGHAASGLRTNCNTCHHEKGDVEVLRGPHPERTNCLQCHVPSLEEGSWPPAAR
jgi:nitrate reductase cytochrome c-type subunit